MTRDDKERGNGHLVGLAILVSMFLFLLYIYSGERPGFHLSLGLNDNEYYLTWSSNDHYSILVTSCSYGTSGSWKLVRPDKEAVMKRKLSGVDRYFKYIFKEKITVEPNTKCTYSVQDCSSESRCRPKSYISSENSATFKTKNLRSPTRPFTMAFFGDLGIKNGKSIPRLTRDVQRGMYDLVFHNGDFAYDLDTDSGSYGDRFLDMIQPIASVVPYQTSVGNHEIADNFTEYDTRFTMINSGPIENGARNNFYYSFDIGPVHFVVISTEFYYFLDRVGISALHNQWKWLEQDLAHANSPAERRKRPWIITFGHRPMYCSSRDQDDCSKDSNLLRRGLPFTGAYALEKLLYDNGVDVEIYSHEHQYERFLPIYDGKVYNGTTIAGNPYHNPRAPVHIISGSAGCQEDLDPFKGTPVTGSVKQISEYGYSRLTANRCRLSFQQVSDDKEGRIVDEFVISKDLQSFPNATQFDFMCNN